jgi:hypothetical protein
MITGEEKALVMQHDAMAASMTGSRNNPKARLDFGWCSAVEDDFGIGLRGQVSAMNYPCSAKVVGEPGGVGHIVLVGQKDVANTAQRFEAAHQMPDESRRIYQPVAVGVGDEIAVGAETFV